MKLPLLIAAFAALAFSQEGAKTPEQKPVPEKEALQLENLSLRENLIRTQANDALMDIARQTSTLKAKICTDTGMGADCVFDPQGKNVSKKPEPPAKAEKK
jgi:hypothetical protein